MGNGAQQRRRHLLPVVVLLTLAAAADHSLAALFGAPLPAGPPAAGDDDDDTATVRTLTHYCSELKPVAFLPAASAAELDEFSLIWRACIYAMQRCSRTCESEHCVGTYAQAPLMRYGKYCGVAYTGCPGEHPCDALDACCMLHDACVQATDNDYLNTWCNQSLLDCVAAVRTAAASGGGAVIVRTFEGNQCNMTDVADEITSLVEAAVFAKRILHRP
ncbi:hypothetical protein ABZP36_009623 [Zizania latifolia]